MAEAIADARGDPRGGLAQAPMTPRQVVAIGLCVLLNALDGFDVLSISFASPGIAREWGIGRGGAALSPVAGGLLFQAGFSLPAVAALLALPARPSEGH